MTTFVADNSMLSAMAECDLREVVEYGIGYRSKTAKLTLESGNGIHKARALFWKGEAVERCMSAFEAHYAPFCEEYPPSADLERLSLATEKGLVRACHDLSEGGISVALAEMAFAGGLGALVHLKWVPLGEPIERDDFILFSESNSRFLVEVALESEDEFREIMKGVSLAAIGQVTDSEVLEIYGLGGQRVLAKPLSELKEAWQKPIRW